MELVVFLATVPEHLEFWGLCKYLCIILLQRLRNRGHYYCLVGLVSTILQRQLHIDFSRADIKLAFPVDYARALSCHGFSGVVAKFCFLLDSTG